MTTFLFSFLLVCCITQSRRNKKPDMQQACLTPVRGCDLVFFYYRAKEIIIQALIFLIKFCDVFSCMRFLKYIFLRSTTIFYWCMFSHQLLFAWFEFNLHLLFKDQMNLPIKNHLILIYCYLSNFLLNHASVLFSSFEIVILLVSTFYYFYIKPKHRYTQIDLEFTNGNNCTNVPSFSFWELIRFVNNSFVPCH